MKAVINTEYGSPDVLKVEEIEKPVPKDNEVLIRVHATTVNRTDCALLRAKPFVVRFATGLLKPKKTILGSEFAGEIEVAGKDVDSFKAGDKVFGFNDSGTGAHAQYMTMHYDKGLAAIPKDMPFEQAAACTEGTHYAYNFLNKVNIVSGQKILVNGAAGGIGSAMVQLLKYHGTDVTGVCKTKDLELVKSLGAKRVIDYTKDDFTKDDQIYDFVFDAVGKSTFFKCKHLLRPKGAYISSELGPGGQNIFLSLFTPILPGNNVKFPMPLNTKRSVLFVRKLIEQGQYQAVIDRTYPLEEIVDAYRYVETGEKTGSVVIKVD